MQQTLENSSSDGNTRPPSLSPEKSVCRSRSNSQNQTWNNRLVPNWDRSVSILSNTYCKMCNGGQQTWMVTYYLSSHREKTQFIKKDYGFLLSPCLFNLYAEYIMRNARLDEAEAGIKIAGRNINNLRQADDTNLMAEVKRN